MDFIPVNRKSVASAIRGATQTSKPKSLQFPEDIGAHGIMLVFKKYKFVAPGERRLISAADSIEQVGDSILLPLPANISDSYSIRIGRPELGIVNETAAVGASGAVGSSGGVGSAIGSTYDAIAGLGGMNEAQVRDLIANGSSSEVSQNIQFLMRSTLQGSIGTAIGQGLGSAVNPKMSLSFDGIDLKNHSFDWRFMVRSENESNLLRDIQTTVKRNIHSSYTNVGKFQRAMLNYPSVVDVYFVGLDADYFMKFKTCMVQSFSLNFAPENVAIVQGGRPAGALMTIQLVETDIHTAEDYGAPETTVDIPLGDPPELPDLPKRLPTPNLRG